MGIFDNLFKKKKDASNQDESQFVRTPKHESIADPETALLLLVLRIENQTCPTQFIQSEFMETFAEDFPSWSKRVFAEKISDTLPKTNRTDLIQASYQAIMNLSFERRKSALLSPCFYNCQSKYQSGLKHLRSCVDSYCVSAFKLSELSEYNRFFEEKNEEVMVAVRDALKQHHPDFVDYHKAKTFFRIDKDPKGSDTDQFLLRKTKDGIYEGVNLKLQGMMKVAVWNSMLDYWKIHPDDAWVAAENNMAPDVKETKSKGKKDNIAERSISAGYTHVLAITELGHVVTAGSPPAKQDDFGIDTWRDIASVCAGGGDDDGNTFSVALDFQGRVHVVNDQVVKYDQASNWRNVVSISAGSDFIIGLKKDGSLYAVGRNNEKQCDVKSWKNVVKIATGDNYTLGLTDNGTILFAGNDLYSPSEATKWIDIVDISAAQTYVIGLKKDGTAVTTSGTSYLSKPCDVSTWKELIMVSAGATFVVGLTKMVKL